MSEHGVSTAQARKCSNKSMQLVTPMVVVVVFVGYVSIRAELGEREVCDFWVPEEACSPKSGPCDSCSSLVDIESVVASNLQKRPRLRCSALRATTFFWFGLFLPGSSWFEDLICT